MNRFQLNSKFQPAGDQPQAIARLVDNLNAGLAGQILLGVTGSGKTFTMANVIAEVNRPTLILSHNKTLAAQLYGEFKQYFPNNAVEFFISYYDYYQPEAYLPQRDLFIEKDASVNDEIDKLRLRATTALMERRDVIIIASVSCIYGLGSPDDYKQMVVIFTRGQEIEREALLRSLVDILYTRNDLNFVRGTFRVRGDVIEIYPAYDDYAIRVEMFGDEIETISKIDPVSGKLLEKSERAAVYPAKHFVMAADRLGKAISTIEVELEERLQQLRKDGKVVEAHRLEQRTRYDIEMLWELGYCSGIENYSRPLGGRPAGARPMVMLDFFPDDFITIIDESHQTIPQVRAMYNGDRQRKETLVEHGFRLPSALDNRPLKFAEFEALVGQTIFVSATPGPYELERYGTDIIEQIVRPTGLIDPEIEVRPVDDQIDDLIDEIRMRVSKGERVLATTLTKKMSEDLTDYLHKLDIRVRYLHSEISALERVDIIRSLRIGDFDVLVGVNLLREGLDLPELSLVAILDADKEGFLRSETSLLQTAGRAARNVHGKVILYADKITESMRKLIETTNYRRAKQDAFNQANSITPETVYKTRDEILQATSIAEVYAKYQVRKEANRPGKAKTDTPVAATREQILQPFREMLQAIPRDDVIDVIKREMESAATNLDYERAIELRDFLKEIDAQNAGQKPK
jgi:excinuclease ABC subunit B